MLRYHLLLLLHGADEHGRQLSELAVLHAEMALGVHLANQRVRDVRRQRLSHLRHSMPRRRMACGSR